MPELIPRHLLDYTREALDAFPAVVVQGARQVGKSTFTLMVAQDRPHVHLSLDDREVRTAVHDDPRAIAELKPDGLVIIDEIQRDLDLTLALKASIDANRRPGRFLLTGSSDLMRLTRNPDSLAGRAVTVNLYGLSQGEIAGELDDFAAWMRTSPAAHLVSTNWGRDDYISALSIGGYPELLSLSARMRTLWLDSYVDRVLSRDIGDVSRGLSTERLSSILRLIATNPSGELIQWRLASSLDMPKSSIAAYLNALQTMYLTMDLPPWGANLTSREVSRHKVSVADSAVTMRLAPVDTAAIANVLTQSPVLDGLLESFVVAELTKQSGWTTCPFRLYHFRDSDGIDVDVVLEYENGDVLLIEVEAVGTYGGDQTSGIRSLARRLGPRFVGGVVLGTSKQGYVLGDRIVGLPISSLWQHQA